MGTRELPTEECAAAATDSSGGGFLDKDDGGLGK